MVFKKTLILVLNILLFSVFWLWLSKQHDSLINSHYILGWSLLILTIIMTLFNIRKRLSSIPLGKVSNWYTFHIYAGCWCALLFYFHAGFNFPDSLINQAIWLGYLMIIMTGVLGYLLITFLTPKVSAHGERLIFDRIPAHISINTEKTMLLMQQTAASINGKPLFDYFNKSLTKIFHNQGQLGLKMIGHKRRLSQNLIELEEIERYLDAENVHRLKTLKTLLIQKYMLTWQYSTLSLLRNWTAIHVPIIWFTIVFLLFHVITQYAFKFGVPW